MDISLIQSFGLFFTSFAFVSLATPFVRKLAIRLQVVDIPSEEHKTHREPVPYLGGAAIVLGVLFTTYAALIWSDNSRMIGLASTVLVPAVFMAGIGLIDDIKKLSPWPRFVVQNIVGLVISVVLVATNSFGSPTGSKVLDLIISIVWIVGITNSINFFDNVDGGASGTVAISALFLFFLSIQGSQYFIAALSVVLAGSTFGFLLWNKPPARIYMGDAGALFLGVLLATLTLRFDPNPIDRLSSLAIPVLLLAIPILDTSVAVASRLRRGISPFQGGQDHLSHRLMRSKFSKRQSISILWLLSCFFALFTIAISSASYELERRLTVGSCLLWIIGFLMFIRTQDEPNK
jgi:UDP-GlcNAc:undecaprenyl-phosphate/decaprenyl-phosphate GlcNAc-1-phosphate transferase